MIFSLKNIPENPGVYLMKKKNEVIYVGKAKNLKKRISSYFNRKHDEIKTQELVKNIEDIETIICNSELDALVLENNLIKQYSPKYNILLKDQKTYPYLKITKETFPAIKIVRNTRELRKKDGRFYGPYIQGAFNLKKTLNRVFKIRDCNRNMEKVYLKPCLKYYMHFCIAPCCFKEVYEEYNMMINGTEELLKGKGKDYINLLKNKMKTSSEEMEFEKSILYREQIKELENSVVRQVTESQKNIEEDYFSFEISKNRLFITVLSLREGKIIGKNSTNLSLKNKIYEDVNKTIIMRYYSKNYPPKKIIFSDELEGEKELLKEWFEKSFDRNIEIFFPKILSRKRELLDMAKLNLQDEIETYYRKKTVLENGLTTIYKTLLLKQYPRRIECFDISNISGKDAVASMSVAIEGRTTPKEYRKFKITCKDTPDDFAMMREVVTRRYSKLKIEEFPNMILIDGGLGQINAVGAILESIGKGGIADLISLAKREEEVYKYGESTPYIFDKTDESIKIFQRVRDEAHRFGITYHRQLRSKRVLTSDLDEIHGIGDKRKHNLIEKFETLDGIYNAPLEELKKIVPEKIALEIKKNERKKTR
jgi:excinuclease ABC subunit C